MNINVERIYRVDTEGPLKGFADINIDNSIIIKALRIVEGKEGLYVGLPRELGKDGRWYDRIAITKPEIKTQIASIVLDAYSQ